MSNNNLKSQNVREEILLKRFEFFTQEARHQRMMMWETAKWFAAIAVGLVILFGQLFISFNSIETPILDDTIIPILILILILITTIVCLLLLRSFYRTNLIYVSMFGKIEEELGFDKRSDKRCTFYEDEFITWNKYKDDRQNYKTSKEFVDDQVTIWGAGIYARLSWIFIFYITAVQNNLKIGPRY